MKNEDRLLFDGYLYGNEEDVKLAKEEKKKALFIESKVNYDDLQMTLKVYEKALKEKIFRTPAGFEFLKKMRTEMVKRGMPVDKIAPIPLYQVFSKDVETRPIRIFQVKESKEDSKELLRKSVWLNIGLLILVIGMFLITMFGSNTNILNYKYKIENEYAAWQQELEKREAIIREKEAQLNIDNER